MCGIDGVQMVKLSAAACSILFGGAGLISSAEVHAQVVAPGRSEAVIPASPEPPEVLTEDEAAALLRVERVALLDLALSGQVPGPVMASFHW